MKEKLLTGIVAMSTVLAVATSTVNAAKLEISADKVEAGKTVDVTVALDSDSNSIEYELTYDATKFKYVSSECDLPDVIVNAETAGTISVAGASATKTTKSMKITLEALKDGNAEFEVSGLVTSDDEPLAVSKATVEVQEATATPTAEPTTTPEATPETTAETTTTPEATAESTDSTDSTNKSSNTNKSNGKTNPTTGDGIVAYIAGLGAAIVAMVAIAVKKFTK